MKTYIGITTLVLVATVYASTAAASLGPDQALPTTASLSYAPVPLLARVNAALETCLKGHLGAQVVHNDHDGVLDAYYPNGSYSLTVWGLAPAGLGLAGSVTRTGHYAWGQRAPQWQSDEMNNCLLAATNLGACIEVETNAVGHDYCAEWLGRSGARVQSPAWATRP